MGRTVFRKAYWLGALYLAAVTIRIDKMRELSTVELEEVSGGVVVAPVVIGAVAGGLWGGFQYATGGNGMTWTGAALAIGSGMVGGAVASMGGFAFAFYGSGLGAIGGVAANSFR